MRSRLFLRNPKFAEWPQKTSLPLSPPPSLSLSLSLSSPFRVSPSPGKVNCCVVGAKLRSRLIAGTNHRGIWPGGRARSFVPRRPKRAKRQTKQARFRWRGEGRLLIWCGVMPLAALPKAFSLRVGRVRMEKNGSLAFFSMPSGPMLKSFNISVNRQSSFILVIREWVARSPLHKFQHYY